MTNQECTAKAKTIADQLWAIARSHKDDIDRILMVGMTLNHGDVDIVRIAMSAVAGELIVRELDIKSSGE